MEVHSRSEGLRFGSVCSAHLPSMVACSPSGPPLSAVWLTSPTGAACVDPDVGSTLRSPEDDMAAMMDVGFSIRSATPDDQTELRKHVDITLGHPEGGARPPSLKGSIEREEVLVLEYFDPRERVNRIGGFIEYRLRVDDTLTIH